MDEPIWIGPESEKVLAARHLAAAEEIAALAGSVPHVDAGQGQAPVLTILGTMLSTSGRLAEASALTADAVAEVVRCLAATDERIGGLFHEGVLP